MQGVDNVGLLKAVEVSVLLVSVRNCCTCVRTNQDTAVQADFNHMYISA